ncbi:hypothetical protein [Stenotrophomonas sp. RG-453]|uniref:hypothetical protein n=1 Tax=Stenotrophomonas sp. RG-453 TaxID=2957502 RepID=UPI0029C9E1E9|nr:hypothetical protein [Stenotrophomonas sp. RG-453]MDX5515847.1 hypothetical protein [Stenotrophomonas sp. RG-453]
MSDIPFQSKKIEGELRHIDATCAVRLLDNYDRCSSVEKLDFVAALIAAILVARAQSKGGSGAQ